ncbi:hypothetical protein KGD82_25085 [Nocardiopsis eucommiae]|uniref:Uncharacterized protein n=1 Tax=Nocardiopsis eucommiae TaxID=2831970 RepID=A0A975QJ67_9ACTN|nr:hypothetical protein KGD82_25085 [Nocardiopsis eucommiae]
MSTSRMPLALRALRTLLWILAVFGAVGLALGLVGLAVMTEEEVVRETGVGRSASMAALLPGFALVLVEAYLAATLIRGGRARRWCVRVLAVLTLLSGLLGLLFLDVAGLFEVAVAVLLLALHESRSAREWYRSGTETGKPDGAVPAPTG